MIVVSREYLYYFALFLFWNNYAEKWWSTIQTLYCLVIWIKKYYKSNASQLWREPNVFWREICDLFDQLASENKADSSDEKNISFNLFDIR